MKKLILVSAIILLLKQVTAQPAKGSIMTGGGLGGSIKNNPYSQLNVNRGYKENSFVVTPQLGYFFSDKYACGFYVNYKYAGSNYNYIDLVVQYTENNNKEINNAFGGGVFTRHYKSIVDKLYLTFYCEFGYDYSIQKGTREYIYYVGSTLQTQTSKTTSQGNLLHLTLGPGFEYFLSPHIGLRASFGSFGYSYSRLNTDNANKTTTTSSIDFNFNQSMMLFGLNYIFQRKPPKTE